MSLENSPLWQRIEPIRVLLVLVVMAVVVVVLTLYGAMSEQTVFSCSDKEKNPHDIQKLCKELTKSQWWGAYYQGVKK